MKHIIIYGNPSDGFTHVGPFEDGEAANTYVENTKNIRNDNWWLVKLESPVIYENARGEERHVRAVVLTCDCGGCNACDSHCVSDCASGNGETCLTTVKVRHRE